MEKAVSFFYDQVRCLRLGTISTALVETVKAQCYGNQTPLKHIANCQKVQNGISVEPFDPSLVGPICVALKAAGFNAYQFSKACVMVSVPPPSGDERQRVHKRIRELGEEAKIAVRQVRQKYKKQCDKEEHGKLQRVTDEFVAQVDKIVMDKVASI
jgi:ribosome recycling factor